ncbi:MAG: thiol reductant ABC exporter subunit CydD [Tetrasphaera jenkinsii]|nr:thiol reductant ABC exporter subunit CydD [Tetrasphaera jenkinsii]
MRPFDPALLRAVPEVRRPLAVLGAVGIAQGATTIATAFALTGVVVALATESPLATDSPLGAALAWLVLLFVVRGLLTTIGEYAAARAGADVSTALRRRLLGAWTRAGRATSDDPAARLTLATAGCTSIEPYAARFLPALVAAAIVPAGAVLALMFVDWASALVVVLTLPLLPLFAALIGRTTAEETQRRWRSLADLSGHFLDVVRGLPTLVNYGRAERQLDSIERVSDRHRLATVRTLRLAFLSTGALELLATISVAIVAVLCGVRLAHGSMPLDSALLAILLAPEAYWPIRRVGQEFHSAAEGATAIAAILGELGELGTSMIDRNPGGRPASSSPTSSPIISPTSSPATAQPARVAVDAVTYTYPGAAGPVIRDLSLVADAGLTVLTGASGVGKTTVLELIAGLRRPDTGKVTAPRCHLVTQRPFLPTGTLRACLALGNGAGPDAQWAALREVGLDGFVAALPNGLDTVVGDDGFGLSAGQRARIGLARALLAPETVILLDEPTAHLDDASAELAHSAISLLAQRACVIAITHRHELLDHAQHHVHLTGAALGGRGIRPKGGAR